MRRWLGWFALALIIGMQAGTVFKPLGSIGPTRTADWAVAASCRSALLPGLPFGTR